MSVRVVENHESVLAPGISTKQEPFPSASARVSASAGVFKVPRSAFNVGLPDFEP